MLKKVMLAAALAALCFTGSASAQQQPPTTPAPITRTVLQKQEFPGSQYATYLVKIDIVPNGAVGKHNHPGIEMGTVIAGETDLTVEGKAVQHLKVGDSYSIPAGVPHSATAGPQGSSLIATFVVNKDKPLASPVP
jgi:quercetin dioxygenase-like cupin family protein